ncbi:MAG: tRNA (N6-isopentenyl adenosine(37)-C2)-methylthiotransferase MiaB [Patescibacteria group bacterium]|nr:tRNA (N6-isopentenyl adenosine(37)-C2)-methylthiotransferase MiaB [Patescibacteria group bacterium]
MVKKYYIITYGCQMNKSDSERIAVELKKIKYKPTSSISEADLIAVNMCSIRQSAVNRVYGLIQKFRKQKIKNPKLKTLLTGCILKKDLKKFKDYFDYILSIKTLPYWKNYFQEKTFLFYPNPRDEKFNNDFKAGYLKIKPTPLNNFSALIPISNGCDNFCSFCVVPYTRGAEFSRPSKNILKETKEFIKKGYKEIWLLGQNVNEYNDKQGTSNNKQKISFSKLLKLIDNIPGNFWIRFTSSNPKDFSNEMIKTMAISKKITPYLNLPIQSGNDKILKKMNRKYTIKDYKNLVKKIRKNFKEHREGLEKEIALSTDIIVGFPSETRKQFNDTVKIFKEIKFDMAYISKFSPRPETLAQKMKDDVSQKEKNRREKALTEMLKKIALKKNEKYINKTIEVLPTQFKNNFLIGKSRHYKTVKFKGRKELIGKFVKVKVTKAMAWGLNGKLI